LVIEAIATYHGTQDMVQVAAVLQEEDGTSLHRMLESGLVSLTKGGEAILTKELEERDYNEGEEGYWIFFIHPPLQNHLRVRFEVELQDGRTGYTENEVSVSDELPYHDIATNPMLSGKPVKDHANTWDEEGRERHPD